MNEEMDYCDGCHIYCPDVQMYWPDDTAAVWSLCAKCRKYADELCTIHRLSATRVAHREVLDRLVHRGISINYGVIRTCPLCLGKGQITK